METLKRKYLRLLKLTSTQHVREIKDIPDSFIAADDIPVRLGNKIPLCLFGFLY
ncbi:MAG: hypothetical protein K2N48_13365 [Muribaculaceae bacterium]|nr:hypothetical protein [Muribaculaceae bacterium]